MKNKLKPNKMKTKEQILQEWLSKDGMGINYTTEQRILLAMQEYADLLLKSKK